ncbi:hypothetical protein [uncultured Methanobrevibacter sp.]|uniref:hypothetical protein n=1 Tax=uncultured Methanobrevibacter sp. TaxID=253161 RepID=UPI0025FDA892|nr:hypothetical protein [uncultured Methanobrevibacter sp.]
MVFSVLLVGVSSVCAQDTNTIDNITDLNNNNVVGQINIDENYTTININNTTYSHSVDFGDAKINIVPMINKVLTCNYTSIGNFTCVGLFDANATSFNFVVDHPVYDGNNTYVMMSLNYMFSNLNGTGDIFSKLETGDYSNSMMLTRTVHVNSVESYEHARTTTKAQSFSKDMINACFEIFDKKYIGTSLAVFSTNLGRTACFFELKKHNLTFNYNVLFDDAYVFNKNTVWDLDALEYDIVHIDGHGSTIIGSAEERTEYKWANIGSNMLYVNNMTIKGFNNAIVNRGFCSLDNVILRDNKMDYGVDRDWGAAILNAGYCVCNNCSFINNYASKGGAVFSQGEIHFNNCTFSDNKGYRFGDNVFNVDKGKVFFDNREIILDENNKTWDNGLVTYRDSISVGWVTAASVAGSFVLGAVIGFFSGGSGLGVVGSGITGCGLGIISYLLVNSYYYDINFNVKGYAIGVIIRSVTAGIAGAFIGGFINKLSSQNNIEPAENNRGQLQKHMSNAQIKEGQIRAYNKLFSMHDDVKSIINMYKLRDRNVLSDSVTDEFMYKGHNLRFSSNIFLNNEEKMIFIEKVESYIQFYNINYKSISEILLLKQNHGFGFHIFTSSNYKFTFTIGFSELGVKGFSELRVK